MLWFERTTDISVLGGLSFFLAWLFCTGFGVFLLPFSHLPEPACAALPWMGMSDFVGAAASNGDHWQRLCSGYSSESLCMKPFMLFWVHVSDPALLGGFGAVTSCTFSAGSEGAQYLSESSQHHAVLGNLITPLLPPVLD